MFNSHDDGIYLDGFKICSPLKVRAWSRDKHNANWGRLLEITDREGKCHEWILPSDQFDEQKLPYLPILRSLGLEYQTEKIEGKSPRSLIHEYLAESDPDQYVRSVDKPGWHNDAFVLLGEVIGTGDESLIYQPERESIRLKVSGSLKDWQEGVSLKCAGNSRLVTAISTALAAPLLYLLNIEGGGLHFRGDSSKGKTTALLCANSVYGGEDLLKTWRTTSNGLEAIASERCDLLLCLDEIGQVDPRDAGEIAYMLSNGKGKVRAKKDGSARDSYEWRLLFLSSGELDLAGQMSQAGRPSTGGQEVRLLQISADAGRGMGLFEHIHDAKDPSVFALHLGRSAKRFYGSAGKAFIEYLVADQSAAMDRANEYIRRFEEKAALESNADGQVKRALQRFALIAAAGEMATSAGITGWKSNEATNGALACFKDWITTRGGLGSHEESKAVEAVKRFLQEHESRFEVMQDSDSPPNRQITTKDRVGYMTSVAIKGETPEESRAHSFFYCFKDAFRHEICKGVNAALAIKSLQNMGVLEECNVRIPAGSSPQRYWKISSEILSDEL